MPWKFTVNTIRITALCIVCFTWNKNNHLEIMHSLAYCRIFLKANMDWFSNSLEKCEEVCWNVCTLMDKSIHTPVKRQYINALFEMAVYQRRRVATILNFLSFSSIDIKGFSFNFGRKRETTIINFLSFISFDIKGFTFKIFTGFKMAELESYTSTFFLYFIT